MSEPLPGPCNFTSIPDGSRRHLQPAVFGPWGYEKDARAVEGNDSAGRCTIQQLNSGQSAAAYGGKTGCSVATRSTGGTVEPWHMLRLRPTSDPDGQQSSVLVMPPPRRALRHALPVVLEGVVGPRDR